MRMVVLGAIAVVGIGAARAASPSPGPDWSADRFLLGTWVCDLARSGHPTAHERARYSLGLADRWLKLTYTKTSGEPGVAMLTTDAYESFDSQLKKWVYVSMDSDGGYGMAYSEGWKGATKIYGPQAEEKRQWRLVTTRVSEREFTEEVDLATADGQWRRSSSLRCRKSG